MSIHEHILTLIAQLAGQAAAPLTDESLASLCTRVQQLLTTLVIARDALAQGQDPEVSPLAPVRLGAQRKVSEMAPDSVPGIVGEMPQYLASRRAAEGVPYVATFDLRRRN